MSSEGPHYVNHSRKLRLVPSAVGNCSLKRSLSLQAGRGHYTPCEVGRKRDWSSVCLPSGSLSCRVVGNFLPARQETGAAQRSGTGPPRAAALPVLPHPSPTDLPQGRTPPRSLCPLQPPPRLSQRRSRARSSAPSGSSWSGEEGHASPQYLRDGRSPDFRAVRRGKRE